MDPLNQGNSYYNFLKTIKTCQSSSNLTIVCSDMNIMSHKIIFASISNYVKHLLSEIPLGDEVTIFLPDYTGKRVEKFINAAVFPNSFYDEELSRHFRAPKPKQGHVPQPKMEATFEEEEKHSETNQNNESKSECADLSLEQARQLTPAEQSYFNLMQKRMAYDPAIKEIKSGHFVNFQTTAKKFGVSSATLKRLVITNRDYQGKGKTSPFSFEEEQDLRKRIMLASKNGENISYKLIKHFIRDESIKISTLNPERLASFSKYLNPAQITAHDFAKKHGLVTLIKEKRKEELSRYFGASESKQVHASQSKIEGTFIVEEKHLETNTNNESRDEFANLPLEETKAQKPKQRHASQSEVEPTFEVVMEENHSETNPNNESKADCSVEETRLLTPAEQRYFTMMKKRMAYGPALKEIKSGQFINFHTTAMKFGVSSSTLKRLFETNKDYQGKGKTSPFSLEEELDLRKRIMLASKNGEDLSTKLIKNFISDESIKISTLNPERLASFSKYLNPASNTAYDFAKKHGLDTFIKEKRNIVERDLFDCDICAKSFTFRNSMLTHKKKVHHIFLEK